MKHAPGSDLTLPALYAILDAETCARRGLLMREVAEAWREAGLRLVQYRDKQGSDEDVLRNCALLRQTFEGTGAKLILNDRVHLFHETGFDGVHVGQTDMPVDRVRELVGRPALVGVSTHNPDQLRQAEEWDVSYIAAGPVFTTGTKRDADPVIGLEGLRAARALTSQPLVAIGGITRSNAAEVLAAGANAVAIISGLLPIEGGRAPSLREMARDCLIAAGQSPS